MDDDELVWAFNAEQARFLVASSPRQTALESLIGFLREDSPTVRHKAADAIGSLFWSPRSSRRGAHGAALALAHYFDEYPGDTHYHT